MAIVCPLFILSPSAPAAQPLSGWDLVWSDEFNGATLDTGKWALELNEGDPGVAVYTKRSQNLFVSNGCLALQAQKENYNGKQYTSTQISSRNKGYWRFCRIDVRAKLPHGQGMWPAIWMMPQVRPYGGWPGCGEIDNMENLGNNTQKLYTTLHYSTSNQSSQGTYSTAANQSLSDSFHVYTMIWDSGSFGFYIDSIHNYWNCTHWSPDNVTFPKPFDQSFFLIFDLAIGGNWAGAPDSITVFPQQMLVDWVHVYQRQSSTDVRRHPEERASEGFCLIASGATLGYRLDEGAAVRIDLFDVLGKRVVSLVNSFQPAGSAAFDLSSYSLRTGIYLCILEAGDKKEIRKIVLK